MTIDARWIRGNKISHALELEILQWRVHCMYILTYEGVFSLNKEWEKEDERKKETTQITNTARTFDIRQHSSPVRGPQRGSVQPQLLPVPSDPFQELSRTRWIPCTRHDSTRRAAHCAEYFAGDLISCRELRSFVELLNGATDQGLVGVWLQESWEYQNFAHSFCSLSLPKNFSSSSCLPPQSLRVFVRCLSSTPTDSLQRVCRVTWPGSQAGMAA